MMNVPSPYRLAFALASVLLATSGCQRSGAYKRDQEFTKDIPQSYYNTGPNANRSSAQRLEPLAQPKKRVLVLNFWNDTPVRQSDIGEFAATDLKRGLFITQRVIIADARSAVATEDFVQGDKIKVAQLIREGRRQGMSVVVIGRVTKVAFRQKGDDVGLLRQKQSFAAVDVEAKIFDVAAGREMMALAKSGEASASAMAAIEETNTDSAAYKGELIKLAVRNAMGYLVPDVIKSIEKMAWEGRIAKAAGSKVYINAGRTSGLVVGDILKVLSPGDDIYDPSSGAYLGRSPGQLKGTVEVMDFIGPDGAATEIHTGGNFQEGDVVQLY
jgi:hypothetical protein